MKHIFIFIISLVLDIICVDAQTKNDQRIEQVQEIIKRQLGSKYSDRLVLKLVSDSLNGHYQTNVKDGKVYITANEPTTLCRGAYNFIRNIGAANVSWTGNRIVLPKTLMPYEEHATSPYRYRYYMNVVTHGYTTPYWQWNRWQQEIDWMAIHGMNMPLLSGAHEAILYRVFKKIGLTDKEINTYFTGPAHLPWNRMGNVTGMNGPLPATFFSKQVALTHQILQRMHVLDMHPIIPAFAGFVPSGIQRLYPNEKVKTLDWVGFPDKFRAHILDPGSPLFVKIGKLYVKEWEKEFGKAEFFLADSFNEMEVPLPTDSTDALNELASYGESVFKSIHEEDPDATWVMQGWTFPFQTDSKTGKLFWTFDRLHALLSRVPDNKLLILDLANDYNHDWWHSDPSWKTYDGFFGKQWIYSFIPNMGGKTTWNGILDTYSKIPIDALKYPNKKNMVGFGCAPEGIENNELVYELIADMAWRDTPVDLDMWIADYCKDRYGSYPSGMKAAFDAFRKSVYGSFTDHPRFKYQFTPSSKARATVNQSPAFGEGVKAFLSCHELFKGNKLYEADAIELSAQYLSLKVDSLIEMYIKTKSKDKLDTALTILHDVDRLLASHPNHRLKKWIDLARDFGNNKAEKDYYEANAKELITIWGDNGEISDYSARMWNGLIEYYYIPRLEQYFKKMPEDKNALLKWEQKWVATRLDLTDKLLLDNPVEIAIDCIDKYEK